MGQTDWYKARECRSPYTKKRVKSSVQCLHLDKEKLGDIGMFHECLTCSNLKELYIYAHPNAIEDNVQLIEENGEWEHIIKLKEYLSSFCERYSNLKALHLRSGGLNVAYLSDKFLNLETFSINEGVLQDSCREFFDNHHSIRHLFLKSCIIECSALFHDH